MHYHCLVWLRFLGHSLDSQSEAFEVSLSLLTVIVITKLHFLCAIIPQRTITLRVTATIAWDLHRYYVPIGITEDLFYERHSCYTWAGAHH
jgi:hypothetical protein